MARLAAGRLTRQWVFQPVDEPARDALARELGCSPVMAQLLLNRGVGTPAEARGFLAPQFESLHDPMVLDPMPRAVERIEAALRRDERICVFADYDVDGVTGAAILVRFFHTLGRPVDFYIPHRVDEGYSLSRTAVDRMAERGAKVIITVDCGTCDVDPIAYAAEKGIDVIVTDHHEPPPELPPAYALLNPKLPGNSYPFKLLCGSAVAFKLAWALAQRLSQSKKVTPELRDYLQQSLALVAIGTIADVVPLRGENRILARFGLDIMRESRNPGLQALLRKSQLSRGRIDAGDVGFKIGPRLNAGGRMGHAVVGLQLLLSESAAEIEDLAEQLETANRDRQKVEAEISAQAKERVEKEIDLGSERVLVLADDRWHTGVVGIACARLVEAFHRPTILIGLSGDEGKGSGRSITSFNLYQALAACRDTMVGFGGHPHAAGMKIRRDQVPELRRRINAWAQTAMKPADLVPLLKLDCEVALPAVGRPLLGELRQMEPFGMGNPRPVFATRDLRVIGEPQTMGKTGDHVSFRVAQGAGNFRAVAFGFGSRMDEIRGARERGCSLAYQVDLNTWGGKNEVELMVKDIQTG